MLQRSEIEGYLGKLISVGIDNRTLPGTLFFYYGVLIDISNDNIKLRINNGYKIIQIDEIKEIHLGR